MDLVSGKFRKFISLFVCVLMTFNLCCVANAAEEKVDVKMLWTSAFGQTWNVVDENAKIFDKSALEPGDEIVRYFDIQDTGDLAIEYTLDFVIAEGVDLTLANAIDVYVKEDVAADTAVSDMTKIGTLADILANGTLSNGKISPDGEENKDGFASVTRKVAVALKMQDTTEYFGKSLSGFKLQLIANETDYTYKQIERFSVKFPNTDKYLYRVGNENAVALSSLFANDSVIGKVNVTIENISGDAAGAYTANTSDWTKGTIQFTGTGSVRVTVDDEGRKTAPTSLCLEVIKATNATSATSAKTTDVVLLNDVGFSTLDVLGGHTLYGNGFTMTCSSDQQTQEMDYSFVKLENGTLDNVRVIVPNFSYSILYDSNKKDSENPYYQPPGTTAVNDRYWYNMRSAVVTEGKSRIVNSYISGGRAAVYAMGGNLLIDNSTIYGGATANIHVTAVKNLILRDATLVQKPIKATVNDTSKTVMGLSIVAQCDGNTGEAAPITLEGDFVQYAWVNSDYKTYVPSAGSSLVDVALSKTEYIHSVTYPDGVTRSSLNLGILYMPADSNGNVNAPSNITDNRTNKTEIPYSSVKVMAGLVSAYVYSYQNSNGTADSFKTEPTYASDKQGITAGVVSYDKATDGVSYSTFFDKTNGLMSKLTVDLDAVGTYDFKFSDLKVMKYGRELEYTVKDSNGATVDKGQAINLTDSKVLDYVLVINNNLLYDKNGVIVTSDGVSEEYNLNIVATKTSINPPEFVTANFTKDAPLICAKNKDGDWTAAFPASLEGIDVKYWSVAEKTYKTVNLGSLIPTSTGKANGTNNYWEYKASNNDFTFRITGSIVKDAVYTMPVVVNNSGNKMYFVMSSTDAYVSTNTAARSNTLTYTFTDNNGGKTEKSKSWIVNRTDYSSKQYSYSDFANGKLSNASSSCLAEGTLITLADGSKRPIEDLNIGDELMAWDFFEGKYVSAPLSIIIDHGKNDYEIITLKFDDGTELKVSVYHGLYNADLRKSVVIDTSTVANYVGDHFAKKNGTAKLVDYDIATESVASYSLATSVYYNCIANDMFTVTPDPVDGWYDYFEIDENMKYVPDSVEENIEKYGLYTYADFEDYLTYEEFIAFNCPYLKIPVGKGHFTFEDILGQIELWGLGFAENKNPDVILPGSVAEMMLVSMNEDVQTIVIISGENSISTATYGISAVANDVTVENGSFTVDGNGVQLKITATGDAKSRHAKITLDGDVYYTAPLASGEETVVTINNANGLTATVEAVYGTHENECVTSIDLGTFTYTVNGAAVTFSNTTKYDITDGFDVFVGIFGERNQLLDIAKKTYQGFSAKTEDTFAPELKETAGTIKTFIWKVGTMVPYFN